MNLNEYPKLIKNAIKNVKIMTRQDIINYFDNQIKYYKAYNKDNPNMEWAKDYPELYEQDKQNILDEFDRYGVACYRVICDGNIEAYFYTNGTYKVYCSEF